MQLCGSRRKINYSTSNNNERVDTCTPREVGVVYQSSRIFPPRGKTVEESFASARSRMEQPTMFGRGGHRVFPSVFPLLYALCPLSTFSPLLSPSRSISYRRVITRREHAPRILLLLYALDIEIGES